MLVVDDDPVILRLLEVNFELEGIRVTTAIDGAEGLRRVRVDQPDVVISDIMMPNVNGLELLAALKGAPETMDLPVILLSASVSPSLNASDAEVAESLPKPFSPKDLAAAVKRVLSGPSK